MNISHIRIGNCLRLRGENLDEFVIVSDVNPNENKISVHNSKDEIIPIDMNISNNCILPIPISDIILHKLGYVNEEKSIYGLSPTTIYSQYFKDYLIEIIMDKEKGWCLVTSSPKGYFGCKLKPIPYLSDLQNTLPPLFTYKRNLKSFEEKTLNYPSI